MKKFLVLLLGALMVLGFSTASFAIHDEASVIEAGSAVAEPGTAIVIGGDARVRGYMNKDFDMNSDSDLGEVQKYDQRARFTINAKTVGGVELRTRVTLSNDGDSGYDWGGSANSHTGANDKAIYWDWAYIHFPVGPVAVDVGNQRFNWGYKFFAWDLPVDRLMVSGKFNNVTLAVGTDKLNEATGDNVKVNNNGSTSDQIGGDADEYFGVAGFNVADWGINVLYISVKDKRPAAGDSDCGNYATPGPDGILGTGDDGTANSCPNTGADADGAVFDVNVDGKIGPVGAHVEYVTLNGDLFTDANDDKKPNGGYIAADYGTGQFVVFAAYAFTKNGYVADNDFAPTLLYGTVQSTAMMNYGQLANFGTADTGAIVVGGFYNINEQIKIGARYANAKLDPFKIDENALATDVNNDGVLSTLFCGGHDSGVCAEGTIQEVDVQADYMLTKNLTYTVAYGKGSLSGDLFEGADDPSTLINMVNYQF